MGGAQALPNCWDPNMPPRRMREEKICKVTNWVKGTGIYSPTSPDFRDEAAWVTTF